MIREEILNSLDSMDEMIYESYYEELLSMIQQFEKEDDMNEYSGFHEDILMESSVNYKNKNKKNIIELFLSLVENVFEFISVQFSKLLRLNTRQNDVFKEIDNNISLYYQELVDAKIQSATALTEDTSLGKLVTSIDCRITPLKDINNKKAYTIIKNKNNIRIQTIYMDKSDKVSSKYWVNTKQMYQNLNSYFEICDFYSKEMNQSFDTKYAKTYREEIDALLDIEKNTIKEMNPKLTELFSSEENGCSSLKDIKTDIDKIFSMIKKIKNKYQSINKNAKKTDTKYDTQNKIGNYKGSHQKESSTTFSALSKTLKIVSTSMMSYMRFIKDYFNCLLKLHTNLDYDIKLNLSNRLLLSDRELKFVDSMDIDKKKITLADAVIIRNILKKTKGTETYKKTVNKLKCDFIYIKETLYLKKLINNLNRMEYLIYEASMKHNWQVVDELTEILFTIFNLKNYKQFKMYSEYCKEAKNRKDFLMVYYDDNEILQQKSNYRYFHFSKSSMKSLNPTHKNKYSGYIYCNFRCYLVAINTHNMKLDTLLSFAKRYGENIYEYPAEESDVFYKDTSAIQEVNNKKELDYFVPVFFETDSPIYISKVNPLKLFEK